MRAILIQPVGRIRRRGRSIGRTQAVADGVVAEPELLPCYRRLGGGKRPARVALRAGELPERVVSLEIKRLLHKGTATLLHVHALPQIVDRVFVTAEHRWSEPVFLTLPRPG